MSKKPTPRRGLGSETMTDQVVAVLLAADLFLLIMTALFSDNFLVALAVVLAASAVGSVIGLLFGIPRRKSVGVAESKGDLPGSPVFISANTSLEDVSDWLTKTIVGVGLISWGSVLATLDRSGAAVGVALFGRGALAMPGGVAVLLASFGFSSLAAYLWFSRHLPAEFDDAYRGVNKAARHGLAQQRTAVAPPVPTAGQQADSTPSGSEESPSDNPDDADAEGTGAREGLADSPGARLSAAVREKYARMRQAPIRIDDWAKGMFGGSAEVVNAFGKRTLSATVKNAGDGLFDVELVVTADPAPATEAVFFLHNTFENTTPAISFDAAGQATLSLTSYGAFTVGVLTDDGTTELELDLAHLPGVSKAFRQS